FQAEDGIRDLTVTGVQTCALPISSLFGPFVGLPVSHTYSDFLPSANLKIDMTPEVVARFAVSQTMTRADYSALAGSTNLAPPGRSEERRVGKEWRSGGGADRVNKQ